MPYVTVNQLIARLQEIAAAGHGDMPVLTWTSDSHDMFRYPLDELPTAVPEVAKFYEYVPGEPVLRSVTGIAL